MKRLFLIFGLLLLSSPLALADGTIDTLSAGSALTGTELLPMFQGSNPAVTTTPGAIATYIQGLGTVNFTGTFKLSGTTFSLGTLTNNDYCTWSSSTGLNCNSAGGATGANPTATAGPTAINGTATTFMRSDAAPAVQKASSSQFGIIEGDGSTVTLTGGVLSVTNPAPSAANPSATAGPNPVNGSATTFMRSDAAPAVQKGSSSQFGIMECDGTTVTCPGGVLTASGGSATAVTVGTTTVGSGTSGYYLYNNGGVLGNQALPVGSSSQEGILQCGSGTTCTAGTITVSAGGTVTSVALSLPSFITVSGSPVTTSGTLTGILATQTANTVFAGPSSGSAAAPTFRALSTADLPPAPNRTVASGGTTIASTDVGGQVNSSDASGQTFTQAANTVLGNGQTVVETDQGAGTITLSGGQTTNGYLWSSIWQGGFMVLNGNGTSADGWGFPGFGALSGDVTSTALGAVTVNKIGGVTITLGTLTNGDVCTYTSSGTVINCTTALGTAATVNTGTSGATIPLLNGNNTYSGNNSHTGTETFAAVNGGDNVQSGTTYTTVASDCGKTLLFTSNSAVTVTIASSIVPASGTGCQINVLQAGTAKVSVNGSAVTAATLESAKGYTGTSGTQYSMITLHLTTISSTTYAILEGDGS